MTHLVVFSHLRWNGVYQRPQQLLTRLATRGPVIFVEEPVLDAGPARLVRRTPATGVEVLIPHTPIDAGGFHDDQLPVLAPLLKRRFAEDGSDDCVAWLNTPMALPLLNECVPRAIVYDCMDQLAAFETAPRQMCQRETALLKVADLVLAAGPSLYEDKRALHPNVMCLPSAVDAAHYAPVDAVARPEAMALAERLQGHVARPRLGFFGVIDERIDLQLLARLADAQPGWQIVMVGPVVRIDPQRLPRRANIHWLGQQPYEVLPQLVAAWDVCLMPFALNDATRFLSPTKTLEYMAAGKPVISTALHDVRALFGDIVTVATDGGAFVEGCRDALAESPHQRADRIAAMSACAWRYSWDDTAAAVQRALGRILATGSPGTARLGLPTTAAPAVEGATEAIVAMGAEAANVLPPTLVTTTVASAA